MMTTNTNTKPQQVKLMFYNDYQIDFIDIPFFQNLRVKELKKITECCDFTLTVIFNNKKLTFKVNDDELIKTYKWEKMEYCGSGHHIWDYFDTEDDDDESKEKLEKLKYFFTKCN